LLEPAITGAGDIRGSRCLRRAPSSHAEILRNAPPMKSTLKKNARLQGFPPLARHDARLLVLGSMPSATSLAAAQYYAHPRNAFWPLWCALLEIAPDSTYAERVRALCTARVAVWDVLASCERLGSADAAIALTTAVPNDFANFFARHRHIHTVLFNGGLAARYFRRWVLPGLAQPPPHQVQVPSTSPAHAGLNFARKLAVWRAQFERARRHP
jgi:double-stranded uracil-DNA glycosylase